MSKIYLPDSLKKRDFHFTVNIKGTTSGIYSIQMTIAICWIDSRNKISMEEPTKGLSFNGILIWADKGQFNEFEKWKKDKKSIKDPPFMFIINTRKHMVELSKNPEMSYESYTKKMKKLSSPRKSFEWFEKMVGIENLITMAIDNVPRSFELQIPKE